MHTTEALLDLHERTHLSLADLLAHCATLEAGAMDQELEGFGYPTLRLQLHHMFNAERYWIGVLQGRIDVDDETGFPDLNSLVAYRKTVYEQTRIYLRSVSDVDLDRARSMMTWGGKEKILVPATVVLRTQTHHYTHLGQILVMVRLMGSPVRGLDLPLT